MSGVVAVGLKESIDEIEKDVSEWAGENPPIDRFAFGTDLVAQMLSINLQFQRYKAEGSSQRMQRYDCCRFASPY